MKFSLKIQPRSMIAIALTVTAIIVISAFVELHQSKNEIFRMLQEEAYSLAETVDRSSANNLLSSQEIEKVLTERLLNNAYCIARLDSQSTLTQKQLTDFTEANNIFRINIFNQNGERVLGSHTAQSEHTTLPQKHSPDEFFQPILRGETNRIVIGLKEARFEEGQRYAVAVKRTKRGGGAIVLNIDAAELLNFRKKIGIGKLIRDISDNSGIEYIALQDSEGIIAAGGMVSELSSIESDSILRYSLFNDTSLTRVNMFRDRETFEVLKPFVVEQTVLGIFRIGLNMDAARATEARMERRIIIMSVVLGVIGFLVVMAIVANQNFRLIHQQYTAISTFTGNILEQMQDAVVTVTANGIITIFNKQAEDLFHITEEEVIGKRFGELPREARICIVNIFGADTPMSEQSITCHDGHHRFILVTISDSKGSDGSIESRTAVIKDMTNTRQLERELQRKDKLTAMGELASGVAHEIRNPINAISMIAQRFEKEFKPQSDEQEYGELTTVLRSETGRIDNIIRQFLSFARPPALNPKRVHLQEFFSHIAALFASQSNSKGVVFAADAHGDAEIVIDPEQCTQAILNLLQNALDATHAGGTITLSSTDHLDGVQITVADTGSGISTDKLGKIFDLYYTTKHDGTGMGLAITQQIIAQHGGTISVKSEEGKGTIFLISLPSAPRSPVVP